MVRTDKKKPSPKGRYPRKKKNRLKDLAPVLAVSFLLLAFLLWRVIAVIPGHGIHRSSEAPARNGEVDDKPLKKIEKRKLPPAAETASSGPAADERPPRGKPAEVKPTQALPVEARSAKEKPEAEKAGQKQKPPEVLPVPVQQAGGESLVSIVIDDVGSNIELLKEAMRLLPRSATFAVIPFQPYSKESAELLHEEGFHVILHSPMEAEGLKKGKSFIVEGMSQKEVSDILEFQLESVPFAEGVNNHTGSKVTKDGVLMTFVMNFLKGRGLYFLDSRTTPYTVALKTARSCGVRSAERKVFLDDSSSESGILLKVDELALLGLKEKKVVGIGHLRPNTVKVLSKRLPYWQTRGVRFISLKDAVE